MKKALKKALFIDRDGTLIVEPPVDMQVDSLAKLEFVPGAISALKVLRGLDFELVMATNQDGLGTDSFPEEDFRIPQEKMLRTLAGEGVLFDDMLIDRTFESDGAPTRKPRTGMFGRYTGGGYDLAASYVVGDRATDILLARNLGARGILFAQETAGRRMLREAGAEEACVLISDSWSEIAEYIRRGERRVVERARPAKRGSPSGSTSTAKGSAAFRQTVRPPEPEAEAWRAARIREIGLARVRTTDRTTTGPIPETRRKAYAHIPTT